MQVPTLRISTIFLTRTSTTCMSNNMHYSNCTEEKHLTVNTPSSWAWFSVMHRHCSTWCLQTFNTRQANRNGYTMKVWFLYKSLWPRPPPVTLGGAASADMHRSHNTDITVKKLSHIVHNAHSKIRAFSCLWSNSVKMHQIIWYI